MRKRLRQLVGLAHDREIYLYLSELETHFYEWKDGQLSSMELVDFIHEFHDGSSREVYKIYTMLKRDQLVARAIGIGLLKQDEVSKEIQQMLSDSIVYFRDHYEIDEDDPLSKLRV